ncbi:hypothetical protein KIN20_035190 [Parelaphostrongylus tenuis]|uniref:glutathione gamma-glutamylcysteinyltransferase n=1 Tax=Parelaphostrongylus tenuis TaxID=148309 RepID=A0AAD5RAR6_PARTN|nr:hypothetical protein KIN20_035190 [Parelaphostrongylus tenuis]
MNITPAALTCMSTTTNNFYRRALPSTCVDFASEEGKRLFLESLVAGNADIYFKLASQFRTQDEPAYCGLSTLVMVLNALEVDPGRVWKAPWRFYHESMLDCCVPLENVKKLLCEVRFGEVGEDFLSALRNDIRIAVSGDKEVIVASYDRSKLQQTGTGHFSPLAAFHAASDRVLIMDVARFKYPPHWVKLDELQKAMCSVDPSTKRTRGYVKLQLRQNSRPLIAFSLKANLNCNDISFVNAISSWKEFLLCDILPNEEELQVCCRKFDECFAPHVLCCNRRNSEVDRFQECCQFTEALSEACRIVFAELRQTSIGKLIVNCAAAALMLAWPYEPNYSERSDRLAKLAKTDISTFSPDTKNEISLLSTQLFILMECLLTSSSSEKLNQMSAKCFV